MPPYLWLLIGILVGLVARFVMDGEAYGAFADVVLGVVGALTAIGIIRLANLQSQLSWAGKTSAMIWGAALLLLLARIMAKKRATRASRALPHAHPLSAPSNRPQPTIFTSAATGSRTSPHQSVYMRQMLSSSKPNREPTQPI